MSRSATTFLSAAALALAALPASATESEGLPFEGSRVHHRVATISGVDIAYREAGDPGSPTILLLHGFPTSSHMFRDLIPLMADRYHVLAPDYPGFGASAIPPAKEFEYSFANFARLTHGLLDQEGVDRYAMYVMDYGAPVRFRMFAAKPERVAGFIIQNGNAYEEGLREFWDPFRRYWAEPTAVNAEPLRDFLTLEATKWQFTHGVQRPELVSPDNFWHVQYLLDRSSNQEVQLELFLDYASNLAEYPKWQMLFREHQPPALLVWGKNDLIFPEEGAHPYKRDLRDLEFHVLDTGHFALEEYGPFIATKMLAFLDRMGPF